VKVVRARNGKKTAWRRHGNPRFAIHPDEYSVRRQSRSGISLRSREQPSRKDFNILKMRFFSGFTTLPRVGEFLDMPISHCQSREDAILQEDKEEAPPQRILSCAAYGYHFTHRRERANPDG